MTTLRSQAIHCLAMLVVVLWSGSWARKCRAADGIRPITKANSVVAIYVEDWGRAASGGPALVMAAWEDGTIIWSEDRIRGGAPYRTQRIDKQKFAALLSRLKTDGAIGNVKLSRAHFGPDSHFTTMLMRDDDKQLKMRSWHELFESSGKTVVTNGGVQALSGRQRLDVLRNDHPEYLHFRLAWAETRLMLSSLIPSTSKPQLGELKMEGGEIFWRSLK